MAPPIRDRQSLPDYAKPTADQIERLGFKWDFDYEYPLPESDDDVQRVQIRDVKHPAPSGDVTKCKAAMQRGDRFPPGVVTKDGRFVDLNTRAKAARKAGRADFPVFVLRVSFENATDEQRGRLYLLGGAFNTHFGQKLTSAELANVVRRVVVTNPDLTAERIASHLGVTGNVVSGIFAQLRAEERAERLGVQFNGSLTMSNKRMLGQRGPKLSDQSWAAIARLANEAGLTGQELSDLCNRVQDAPDADKAGILVAEREAREEQISRFTASGKRRPPLSSDMLKRVRYIVGFKDEVATLVDSNPNSRGDYLARVEEAVSALQELAEAQRALNGGE